MGDKSPKSKKRDQKQKDAGKKQDAASAKAKRDGQQRPVGADKKK
jgi:hypothetical protein